MTTNRKIRFSELVLLASPAAVLVGFALLHHLQNPREALVPPTPKWCKLRYVSSKIRRTSSDITVEAVFKPSELIFDPKNDKLKVVNIYLQDSTGKRYKTSAGVMPGFNEEEQFYYMAWPLIGSELPKHKLKVWIKSKLVLDNKFTLPISIRVR